MASVYRAGSVELRRHVTGMKRELIGKLSQEELNARLREMDRLHKQAGSLPADLARERIQRAQRIRDAIPYPEFQAKLGGYYRQLDNLPGTGRDAMGMRQSIWAAIAKLKQEQIYPETVKKEGER